MTLRELANRVSGHLARGTSPEDCSSMTDAQLYDRCTFAKFEDLDAQEQRAILDVRAQVIADPKAWARAYLDQPEGLDKELLHALFMFTHRAAGPTGDSEAAGAFDIAADQLRDAGIFPWYEIIVRRGADPPVIVRLPENGREPLASSS